MNTFIYDPVTSIMSEPLGTQIDTDQAFEVLRDILHTTDNVVRLVADSRMYNILKRMTDKDQGTGRSIDRPIGTITTKRHWALVREDRRGDEIRMLTTRELQRAMGFDDSYKLTDRAAIDCVLLGNAVCPRVAEQLVRAVS